MRIFPSVTIPASALLASAFILSACEHSSPPGSQHAVGVPEGPVVTRTYETQGYDTYVVPQTEVKATYVGVDGKVREREQVIPETVVVKPRTELVEERRFYNDDYIGHEQSQADRQALSRTFYNACPPKAAKNRAC